MIMNRKGCIVHWLACSYAMVSAIAWGQSIPDHAQPSTIAAEWQYGGFLDAGYLYDFNQPANHLFRNKGTTWRVDKLDLNMAGLSLKKKPTEQSRWGEEALVQGGADSRIFGFSTTAPNIEGYKWLRHIGLADVSYLAPVGKGLAVQGGIFGSLIGYDSLYAKDNLNYTRPWGADYTPYLMMGVNAAYPFSDNVTATVFVVNGYFHLADANHVPSSGGQISYKLSSKDTLKNTVLWGPHQIDTSLKYWRVLTDSILEHKTDRTTVAFEYQFGTERLNTSGTPRALVMFSQLPMHVVIRGPWSATVRPEVAWDRDGRWTSARQTIKAVTSTLECHRSYGQANAILRFEHRWDDSRGPDGGFFNDGYVQPGVVRLKPDQHLVIVGLIFSFDSSFHH